MDAAGPWIGPGPIKRCTGEAPPGAVQPDPGCVARAADDCRNLTGIEPFPACEGEDVLISGWKATERGREVSRALVVVRLGFRTSLRGRPLSRSASASLRRWPRR